MSHSFRGFEALINSIWSKFSVYLRPVSYCACSNYLLYLAQCLSHKLLISIAFKV